jgi:16S rRNA (guanine527-N7)-methyltransferase
VIDAALSELQEVAGPVSRETHAELIAMLQLLEKWNARINLVSPSTLADGWRRHILDSVQLAKIAPDAVRWLDLGSGGGFPGLVLAILLKERPGSRIDLVESNRKKVSFLQAALASSGGVGHVHARRIEDVYGAIDVPEIVTARALAPLPILLELAAPWLTRGARGLFHKGRDYRMEVKESRDGWNLDLLEHPSKVDPEGVVLDIRNLTRRSVPRESSA